VSRRLKLVLEYDGTDFAGWQTQPGQRTVQGELEKALGEVCGAPTATRAAGRTDAGVHAAGQVVSLSTGSRIPEGGLLRGLNSLLPRDVAVLDVAEVAPEFDARFSARGKVYRYLVWAHLVGSPLHERTTWHVRAPLDRHAMRTAAALLVGDHDFAAFRAADCERRTTRRLMARVDVDGAGATLAIEVEATAFLKNMVRIVAGTLVDVGRGRLGPDDVAVALSTGERTRAGVTAPAQGLTLMRVLY